MTKMILGLDKVPKPDDTADALAIAETVHGADLLDPRRAGQVLFDLRRIR